MDKSGECYGTFEALPEEKKKRIIDACLEEFAQNGYRAASSNAIIKRAGISKGILFHYFGNKKNLFLYILDYVIGFLVNEFYRNYKNPSADIFERLMERAMIKADIANRYPLLHRFTLAAVTEKSDDIAKDIRQRLDSLEREHMPAAFENIDASKFRSGIDPATAVEFIYLTLDAMSARVMNKYKGGSRPKTDYITETLDEERKYIEMLKFGVYDR